MNGLDEVHEKGFAQYVVGARPTLRRNAFVLVGDWFAADDLVQQTLIALYRCWERLDRHDALSGYTRTVMVRIFIDERRKLRWTRELLQDSLPEPEPEPEDVTRVGDRLVLLKALSTLSARQRSLVYLRYWEDLSIEDVAQIMGCSSATVRSSTSRAMRILREHLDRLGASAGTDCA
ncbi:SigE family RNA polymerase sigma factor [Streptomyces sp. Tue 6430]|nr:SigE family RNA polymerase sigma factor [Streptomyces sp. Tue 6430]